MSPELVIAALATPTVIVGLIGWLMKRAISGLDLQIAGLQGEVKAMGVQVGKRDVDCAACKAGFEGRIHAIERELFKRGGP